MAVENKICVEITNCDSLVITDDSSWDTVVPTTDIDTIDVTVELDGVVSTIAYANYAEVLTLTPTDLTQSGTTIEDGIYKITIVWTHNDSTEYSLTDYVLQDCEIQCKIDKLVLDVANDTCIDCKNEKVNLIECIKAKHHGLCAALACGNINQAENLLGWLESTLVNTDCKTC